MIIFVLGYFVKNKLIPSLRKDLANLYAYDRQIILANPIKIKIRSDEQRISG